MQAKTRPLPHAQWLLKIIHNLDNLYNTSVYVIINTLLEFIMQLWVVIRTSEAKGYGWHVWGQEIWNKRTDRMIVRQLNLLSNQFWPGSADGTTTRGTCSGRRADTVDLLPLCCFSRTGLSWMRSKNQTSTTSVKAQHLNVIIMFHQTKA